MADYTQLYADAGKQYNIDPTLLQAMAREESGENTTNPNTGRLITSAAGAQGVMQFMPQTATHYGVDVTDPKSSIFGAAHYMSDLLDANGGNLPGALAAYNGSQGDQSQTYSRGILGHYMDIQLAQRKALAASGTTSAAQPEPGVIDVGTPPGPPQLNISGRSGGGANDFQSALTGKGTSAAPPPAAPAQPSNDFQGALTGKGPPAPATPAPAPANIPTITVTPAPTVPAAAPPAPAVAAQAPPAPAAPVVQQPAPAPPQPAPEAAAQPPAPAPAPVAQAQPVPPPTPTPTTAPTPDSWYGRNIGAPVAAMMRPDLPQPPQNYLLNVPLLQSLGSGVVQGTRDVAQTISNAGEWADKQMPWLAAIDRAMGYPETSTLPQQTDAFNQQYSSDIPAQIGRIGGEIGATPPLVGLAARGAGALAGAAPVVGRYLAPAVAGAVGGGAQNLLVSGGTGQAPGEAMATGAVGGGVLGGALGAIGARLTRGASAANDAAAERLGIRLSQGQRAGGAAKRVEDTTKILPGSGAYRFAQEQRQGITRVIAREAGIPGPVEHIDTAMLNAAETRAGNAIENATRRITINVRGDPILQTSLARIAANAQRGVTAETQAQRLLSDVLQIAVNHGGNIPGPQLQSLIARGGPIDSLLSNDSGDVRRMAQAVKTALLDAGSRSSSASADAINNLNEARYRWKVIQTVRPAIDKTMTGTEEMSLPALARAIENNFDMRRLGAGNDMQDLARLIRGPLRELPSSGTAERAAWQRWLGFGGMEAGGGGALWALGHPQLAEAYLAATGIPLTASALAGRLSRFGPGLGIPSVEAARQTFNPLLPRLLGPNVGNQLLLPQGQSQ